MTLANTRQRKKNEMKISMKELNRELTPDEVSELDAAAALPPVFDEDSPEMTEEQLQQFKRTREIREYVRQHDPRNASKLTGFDLHGFAQYIEENGISWQEITPEMWEMFKKAEKEQ